MLRPETEWHCCRISKMKDKKGSRKFGPWAGELDKCHMPGHGG